MRAKVYDWHTVFSYSYQKFLLTFGLTKVDFLYLLTLVEKWLRKRAIHPNGGHPFVLTAYDYLAITLFYMRQYHTMECLADQWGGSKGTICKVYNSTITYLVTSGKLRLPSKKDLSDGDLIVVDATESPINRPQKGQKEFYSGKKKRHTIKTQILFCKNKGLIVDIRLDKGHVHDFEIFKRSEAANLPEGVEEIGDSGYQGLEKLHQNSETPIKKPRGGKLSKEQKASNQEFSKKRTCIEHVNHWVKRFRILKDCYRNQRCNFWKPMFLACVIFNWNKPNM